MKYAIIRLKGHQFKVSEGEEFLVDFDGNEVPAPEVLAMVEDGKLKIGKPVISEAKIELEKIGDEKGKKINVLKYKSKSRYRKRMGFRASKTRYLVKSIKL